MKKIKIIYDRKNCIGAAACAALSPKTFEMEDDGKANLINGEEVEGKFEKVLEYDEEVIEAAMACPVEVIKIIDLDTGEEIV